MVNDLSRSLVCSFFDVVIFIAFSTCAFFQSNSIGNSEAYTFSVILCIDPVFEENLAKPTSLNVYTHVLCSVWGREDLNKNSHLNLN